MEARLHGLEPPRRTHTPNLWSSPRPDLKKQEFLLMLAFVLLVVAGDGERQERPGRRLISPLVSPLSSVSLSSPRFPVHRHLQNQTKPYTRTANPPKRFPNPSRPDA